jgi:hypothetical protein
MAVSKPLSLTAHPAAPDHRPLADHAHSIMVLAANGARRVARQEERVQSLTRAGQASLVAAAREQLRLMRQAQQIRLQLLTTAQREVIDTALRTGEDLTGLVAP